MYIQLLQLTKEREWKKNICNNNWFDTKKKKKSRYMPYVPLSRSVHFFLSPGTVMDKALKTMI